MIVQTCSRSVKRRLIRGRVPRSSAPWARTAHRAPHTTQVPADHCHLNRRLTTRPDRGLDVHPTISEPLSSILFGGRYGIRTHGDPEATTAFEAAPFVRSGNLPPQRLPALWLRHTGGGVPGQCGISAIGKVSSTSAPWVVTYTWFSSFMPSSPPGSPTYTSRHRTTPSSMTPS